MFRDGVVSNVSNAFEVDNLLHQGSFNTLLQSDIDRCAALATATELQHGDIVIDYFNQSNLAAM